MSSPKQAKDLADLRNTITSTIDLLRTFQTALRSPPPQPAIPSPPDPLSLLSDASQLLKAQTTKLSLLILNKPFTPTAITSIVSTLNSSCLPALMTGLELCQPAKYTLFLKKHIRITLSRILTELLTLIPAIPLSPPHQHPDKNTILASTGILWSACDVLTSLGTTSYPLRELATTHLNNTTALLADAIAELTTWDPNAPDSESSECYSSSDDDDDDDDDDDEDGPPILTPTSSDPGTLPHQPSPTLSPENPTTPSQPNNAHLLDLKQLSLKHLRLLKLLLPALIRRRIATFPSVAPTPNSHSTTSATLPQIQSLDTLIDHTCTFTDLADETAGALYEGDAELAQKRLGEMRAEGRKCARLGEWGWEGEEDPFSEWVRKWAGRLGELSGEGEGEGRGEEEGWGMGKVCGY